MSSQGRTSFTLLALSVVEGPPAQSVVDGGAEDALLPYALPYTVDYRFSLKLKFQDWVEVKVGDLWYVVSKYKEWRAIQHLKYDPQTGHWKRDAQKTNEVVAGTIGGWPLTWSED